jgi:hypothetical protein
MKVALFTGILHCSGRFLAEIASALLVCRPEREMLQN